MKKNLKVKVDIAKLLSADRKGARRQLQIANSAVDLLARDSVANFSFEKLAQSCRVTRTLIYRYYPTFSDLMAFLGALIRHRYQEFVIKRMESQKNPAAIFKAYIGALLDWFEVYPNDAHVWLAYFHQSSVTANLRSKNKEMVDMGAERISQMLQMNAQQKRDFSSQARCIQFLITGYLVSKATEERTPSEWKRLKTHTLNLCLEFMEPKFAQL
ncbi:MAG: TetR/AcrR family transcriptional regulator [Bdellovibrionales bacterium]